MRLSRSQKLLLGLFGLATLFLLVDRLFLDGEPAEPRRAQASMAAPEAPPTPPAPAPGAVPGSPAVGEEGDCPPSPTAEKGSLAKRLQALAADLDPTSMRDAFVPTESWLTELTRPAAPEPESLQADLAREFVARHRLTSLLLARDGGVAIIDGKFIRVGQELDGFRLVRLTAAGAVFQPATAAPQTAPAAGNQSVLLPLRPEGTAPQE